jgi:hypothetical protein
MSFPLYSQTLVLDKTTKDTTLCFDMPQARFILKKCYKVDELMALDSIRTKKFAFKDSIILSKTRAIVKQETFMKNQKEMIGLKDHEIASLKLTLDGVNKAFRRQKTYKWCAIIVGGALSGYLGYKYVTK